MRSPCRGCIHERSSSRFSPFGEPRFIGTSIHSLENDEVDRRARLSEKRASASLKPFATLTPGKAWGSSPFGGRLAAYDSRLLQLCRSSDIHGTLDATKPRCASGRGGRSGCARERRDCEIQGEPKSFAALDLGAGAVAPEVAYVTASYRLNGCERRLSRAQVIGSARSHERTLPRPQARTSAGNPFRPVARPGKRTVARAQGIHSAGYRERT